MKTNFRIYFCIKLILIILIFNVNYKLKSQDTVNISKFKFYDIKNNEINLRNFDSSHVFIFYSGISCRSCYIELVKGIRKLDSNLKVICILEENLSVFKRKESIKYINSIVKFDNFIFLNPSENNVINDNFINQTPCIFKVKNQQYIIINFETIFEKNNFKTVDDYYKLKKLLN